MNEKQIRSILEKYEQLETEIDETFSAYCRAFEINGAYGVELFDIDFGSGRLRITQDVSCMGCYNTADHTLPLSLLLAKGSKKQQLADELAAAAKAERQRKADEAAEKERQRRYQQYLESKKEFE